VRSAHRIGAGVALRTLESASAVGGSGATLVFLHGRGHASVLWAPLLAAFSGSRRVIALDLPGFGRSGAPPVDGRGIEYFVGPIEDALATVERPVLVGHSLGGYVALEIALRRRRELAGLVLVDAMGIAETIPLAARAYLRFGPERLARLRGLTHPFGSRDATRIRWTEDDAVNAARLAPLREELLRSRGTRARAREAFAAAMQTNVRDRLHEIDAPTLLVWGDQDETFPLPHAIHARTRIAGSELARVDAGHSPHLARSVTVTRALAGWLERRSL